MSEERAFTPLQTKLHRPHMLSDYAIRPRLHEQLDNCRTPVVLISAPAGYGKSTLVAGWLDAGDQPSAWLSLDQQDSNLRQFLRYVLAAVESRYPDGFPELTRLLNSVALPPTTLLAATFEAEYERLNEPLILVLDDLHIIEGTEVPEFLGQLLLHPPDLLRLILLARSDPMLPIPSLRAAGKLTELRMRDLSFTPDESIGFLEAILNHPVDRESVAAFTTKSEGWPTALRLAGLAMQATDTEIQQHHDLPDTPQYIADYLIAEVLNRLPELQRERLLRCAILDRFSAPLCQAIFAGEQHSDGMSEDGQTFIDWLQTMNLFVIRLDAEGHWFRFHHLFQDFLLSRLQRDLSSPEILELYNRASLWCENSSLLDESVEYALKAENPDRAADILERLLTPVHYANSWFDVDRRLQQLPEAVRLTRPRLLLTEAGVLVTRSRMAAIPPLLDRVEALIAEDPGDGALLGELLCIRGLLCFWQGDSANADGYFQEALRRLPPSSDVYIRALAHMYCGWTAHINGQHGEAVKIFTRSLADLNQRNGGVDWQRLQWGLAITHSLAADLPSTHYAARVLLEGSQQHKDVFFEAWPAWILGCVALQRLEFDTALQHLQRVVEIRYSTPPRAPLDSMIVIALIHQLQGHDALADQYLAMAQEFAQWTGNPGLLETVLSSEARIALLRGDLETAQRWQRGAQLTPNVASMFCYVADPSLNECRVLAASESPDDLSAAQTKLSDLRQATEKLHYDCQTLEIALMQAQVAEKQGQRKSALKYLEEALLLSGDEPWLRPFAEIGTPMPDLLKALADHADLADRVRYVLNRLPAAQASAATPDPGPDELSWREQQVLEALSRHLQNKEISRELNISPVTVKSHLRNIYQKLNVRTRRDAVARARERSLLE